jgi:hypothetical protein
MKNLAPLHLRLANLRRWLKKRVGDENDIHVHPELNEKDLTIFLRMIHNQKIPVYSRLDPANKKFDLIVHEKLVKTVEETKYFYILEVNLNSPEACSAYMHFLMVNHGIIDTPFRS